MFEIIVLTVLVMVFVLELFRRFTYGRTIFLSDDEILLIVILVSLLSLLVALGIIS